MRMNGRGSAPWLFSLTWLLWTGWVTGCGGHSRPSYESPLRSGYSPQLSEEVEAETPPSDHMYAYGDFETEESVGDEVAAAEIAPMMRTAAPPVMAAEASLDMPEAASHDSDGPRMTESELMEVRQRAKAAAAERARQRALAMADREGKKASEKAKIRARANLSTEPEKKPERKVVYTGYLKLRVPQREPAIDEIVKLTEERGGHVASLTRHVMVVRIPAGDFEAVMEAFAKIGELMDRRIESVDVTERYTDLVARLDVARAALMRLEALLEKVTKVKERLRILREIKRLSEQVESLEANLRTLQNLVSYYTITIQLVAVSDRLPRAAQQSPFPWVRGLMPHGTSIEEGKGDFELELPDAFVLFDEDEVYRARSSDTTVIRGGVVASEPLGDAAFWMRAVEYEMEGRGEVIEASGESGRLIYRIFASPDVKPRYYLVAVTVRDDEIYVIEAFFPNLETLETHRQSVIDALKSLVIK